jgi:hypothetical protein
VLTDGRQPQRVLVDGDLGDRAGEAGALIGELRRPAGEQEAGADLVEEHVLVVDRPGQ